MGNKKAKARKSLGYVAHGGSVMQPNAPMPETQVDIPEAFGSTLDKAVADITQTGKAEISIDGTDMSFFIDYTQPAKESYALQPGEKREEHCRCGKAILVTVFRGTGYCSVNCQKKYAILSPEPEQTLYRRLKAALNAWDAVDDGVYTNIIADLRTLL